jgi:hypothetical protein
MTLKEIASIQCPKINFGPPASETPREPYIVARLPKDPPCSFTVFSSNPDDVARSKNLHTVFYGPIGKRRLELWAIIAYFTNYRDLERGLDLLNINAVISDEATRLR